MVPVAAEVMVVDTAVDKLLVAAGEAKEVTKVPAVGAVAVNKAHGVVPLVDNLVETNKVGEAMAVATLKAAMVVDTVVQLAVAWAVVMTNQVVATEAAQ